MTQRTYMGKVAPDWAEYVVVEPFSDELYWANDHRRASECIAVRDDQHVREGWRREELDPLPVEEVWVVSGQALDCRISNRYRTEAEAAELAFKLACIYKVVPFYVARVTQKITQPKPVLPEPIVEKL